MTRKQKWLRWTGLAAVVLVPLAFAGLFVGAIGQGEIGRASCRERV